MPRDGRTMYVYWSVADSERCSREAPEGTAAQDQPPDQGWALRLYDVSTLHPLPVIEYSCDIADDDGYLDGLAPGHAYRAELGCYDAADRWHPAVCSERVETPWEGASPWVQDCFIMVRWGSDLSTYRPPDELALVPAEPTSPATAVASRVALPRALTRKPLPGMHRAASSRSVGRATGSGRSAPLTVAEEREPLDPQSRAFWPHGGLLERLPRFAHTEPPALPFCDGALQAAASRPFAG